MMIKCIDMTDHLNQIDLPHWHNEKMPINGNIIQIESINYRVFFSKLVVGRGRRNSTRHAEVWVRKMGVAI